MTSMFEDHISSEKLASRKVSLGFYGAALFSLAVMHKKNR